MTMQKFAIVDANGVPVLLGSNQIAMDGSVPIPEFDDLAGYAGKWWDGAAWQDRPRMPEPIIGAASMDWTGLPTGATATVTDGDTGAVLATATESGGAIDLTFGDPGRYLIDVTADAPWMPWAGEITC